jgi:hypothetical protein
VREIFLYLKGTIMNFISKIAKIFYCLALPALIGLSGARPIMADQPPTELYVNTVPDGAKVFLGGKVVGITPGLFKVEPGNAKIVVKLEGHDPIERDLEIRASRITRLELELRKQSAKTSGASERIKLFGPSDALIAGGAKWEDGELVVSSDAAATVRLFEVPIANRDQCIIMYRFRIKTEDLKAGVYPEMWCRFPGQGEFFSRGLDQKLRGTNNWASLEIPFHLKKGEMPDLLKLNLVFEGPGTVRLKDIEILATPLNDKNIFASAKDVVEGVGWGAFRVGVTREELAKAVGEPEPNHEPNNPWIPWLSRYHVDCLFSESHSATAIQFNEGFEYPLTSGIKIGSFEKDVIAAYGKPELVVPKGPAKQFRYFTRGVFMYIMDGKVSSFMVIKPVKSDTQAINILENPNAKTGESKGQISVSPKAENAAIVVEGVGWGAFHVGAIRAELVEAIGPPEPKTDPNIQWVKWTKFHIACLFDEQRGAFEVRFNEGFELPLKSGVKIGSSEKEVLLAYGAPDRVVSQAQSKMLEYGNRGVLMWIIDGKVANFTVFKPYKTNVQPKAESDAQSISTPGKRVHLADAHTPDADIVLDLASGQTFKEVDRNEGPSQFTRLGKGDLSFSNRLLACLRGGTAMQWDGNRFVPLPTKKQDEDATGYKLPNIPCRLLITTAEKKHFDVTILSVDKEGGINLEYQPADPSLLPKKSGVAPEQSGDWADLLGGRSTSKEASKATNTATSLKITSNSEAAEKILRSYAEEVWKELPPKLEKADNKAAPEVISLVISQIATNRILPQKDLVDSYLLEQVQKAVPLDQSQWNSASIIEIPKSKNAQQEIQQGLWNPVVVAHSCITRALMDKMDTEMIGKFFTLQSCATVPLQLVDSNLQEPRFVKAYPDKMFIVQLERDVQGLYRCKQIRQDLKPDAISRYRLPPRDASPVQKVLWAYNNKVWEELFPKLGSMDMKEIPASAARIAEIELVPKGELLKEEAEKNLAKLPKADILDRSQWESRIDQDKKQKIIEESKREMAKYGPLPMRWNPVNLAHAMQMAILATTETPESIGKRAMISSAAGYSLTQAIDADPEHPVIATSAGNEMTIVHLRRNAQGLYDLEDFELLVKKE